MHIKYTMNDNKKPIFVLFSVLSSFCWWRCLFLFSLLCANSLYWVLLLKLKLISWHEHNIPHKCKHIYRNIILCSFLDGPVSSFEDVPFNRFWKIQFMRVALKKIIQTQNKHIFYVLQANTYRCSIPLLMRREEKKQRRCMNENNNK